MLSGDTSMARANPPRVVDAQRAASTPLAAAQALWAAKVGGAVPTKAPRAAHVGEADPTKAT